MNLGAGLVNDDDEKRAIADPRIFAQFASPLLPPLILRNAKRRNLPASGRSVRTVLKLGI
jgi:hypothetical protein